MSSLLRNVPVPLPKNYIAKQFVPNDPYYSSKIGLLGDSCSIYVANYVDAYSLLFVLSFYHLFDQRGRGGNKTKAMLTDEQFRA
jgi:hypothetical protein